MSFEKDFVLHSHRKLSVLEIRLFFALTAVETLGCAVYLLGIPADAKNAVFLGYSVLRWIGMLVFGAIFFGSVRLVIKTFKDFAFLRIEALLGSPDKMRDFLGITYAAAMLSGSVLLLPGYRVGGYAALLVRLNPFLIWAFVVSLQIILWISSKQSNSRRIFQAKRFQWMSGLRLAVIPIIILGAIWGLIAFTKLGLKPDTMFWNGSAVPLMLWQVFCGLGVGFLYYWYDSNYLLSNSESRGARHIIPDLVTGLVLWLCAVLVWQLIPQQDSYFAPGAYPPNYEFYPYSDAATYDLSAESAVMGQGLSEQDYVDKPFYSWMLFILHLLSGNQFGLFLFLHTALIAAVIPVMYGIGRVIHSRPAGIALAVVVLLYETNAIIATPWINAPNAKLLLTEPACRLGLALFALWFIRAYRDHRRRNIFLAAAGGVLGLTTMIRYNAWFILPAAVIWIGLSTKKDWKRILINLAVFMVAFILPLMPWMVRTSQTWVTPYFFVTRFQGTVWMQRYAPDILESDLLQDFAFPASSLPTASAHIGTDDNPVPPGENKPVNESINEPAAFRYNNPVSAILDLSSQHFLHNLVTSVLGLPESLLLHDVEHTIRISNSHWLPDWDQLLNFRQTFFVILNLALIGLGIGFAVKVRKPGGWILIIIYLTYNLGLGFARTSGGRYLTPIEWIPIFFYMMGFYYILFPAQQVNSPLILETDVPLTNAHTNSEWKRVGLMMVCILLVGIAVPLTDQIFHPQALPETMTSLEHVLDQEFELVQYQKVQIAIEQFLKAENAVMLTGKGLYPRYYLGGEGEAGIQLNTRVMDLPRLTFTLIGNDDKADVLLLTEKMPGYFPHGATVTVIGCDDGNYVDAVIVVIENENDGIKFYRRTSLNRLMCPLDGPSVNFR